MVLFGGRLGTILVEAGMLSLDAVEEHLARHLRVPRAPLERIARPDREALAALPSDLAGRHHALPPWIEKPRLHAALLDPCDDDAIERLAFATGLSIAPHVVAERRLAALLERYYGIRPDRHFVEGRRVALEGVGGAAPPPGALEWRGHAAPSAPSEDPELARWREANGLAPL